METILENLEELEVTEEQATRLRDVGLIYGPCDDPECGPFFHIDPEHTWEDVEAALSAPCANCGAPILLRDGTWFHNAEVPHTDCLDERGPIGNRTATPA